jgi:hypothetical protein
VSRVCRVQGLSVQGLSVQGLSVYQLGLSIFPKLPWIVSKTTWKFEPPQYFQVDLEIFPNSFGNFSCIEKIIFGQYEYMSFSGLSRCIPMNEPMKYPLIICIHTVSFIKRLLWLTCLQYALPRSVIVLLCDQPISICYLLHQSLPLPRHKLTPFQGQTENGEVVKKSITISVLHLISGFECVRNKNIFEQWSLPKVLKLVTAVDPEEKQTQLMSCLSPELILAIIKGS